MLKLKQEFADFYNANKEEIKECEAIFFAEDHEYLHSHRLPDKWKAKINHLWHTSPLSKIQDGLHTYALMDYELEDLRHDGICGKNLNKKYWVQSYMLDWLSTMPEILTTEYLFSMLGRRKSWGTLIKNAYTKVENSA